MRRVSVIGAGTIGASWAAYFLARGFEVAGYDPAPMTLTLRIFFPLVGFSFPSFLTHMQNL